MTTGATYLQQLPEQRWSELRRGFLDDNYRQIPEFAAASSAEVGASCEFTAVMRDQEPLGMALVRVRSAPVLGGGVAYVAGGPLTRRRGGAGDASSLPAALACLRDEYVKRRGMTLRVMCPVGPPASNASASSAMSELGFAPSRWPRAYRTMMVDVSRPPEEIRRTLAQKWRNCLNRSEREGVRIRVGQSQAEFRTFLSLFDVMVAAKNFDVRVDPQVWMALNDRMHPADRVRVAIAEKDGQPAAAHISSALGDTCVYLLGASNDAGRSCMASYLLQWDAMMHARAQGCGWYDLGGVDADENPGVYRFKAGLGGQETVAAGPAEIRPRSARAALLSGAERVYRALRGGSLHDVRRRGRSVGSTG